MTSRLTIHPGGIVKFDGDEIPKEKIEGVFDILSEDLERRVTALEKAQGASAAAQLGSLSRKHPTEAQRAASRANAIKATEARRKKPNETPS